ncbi:hypothetical protein BJY16_003112 [Actinoplanes octamycinicus]|uniref:Uncharacterized protein n=1 Tax=Actinoplanes octamycinicus TaxID=135948 RepID=A0A7W7M7C1_9ACTN|nr:DUF6301 family protein [Actinoplanes octamycinicus]MBB4739653.1 hypothetical protein [Actinoplanes octamycinicus]GIE54836.1 hypothetical protein Aoc01nite_02380 [Actinoplanes octamycinicus]
MSNLPPAIDQPALENLLTGFRDTAWSWTPDGFPELARRFGWQIVDEDENGAAADVPWPAPEEAVQTTYRRGGVDDVTITLATVIGYDGAPPEFLVDVFATAVRTATAVLGPPTHRKPGAHPVVRWRGEQRTIQIERLTNAVNLVWEDNAVQDIWDGYDEGAVP